MRKGFLWALGLTIGITAVALIRPARPPQVVGAIDSSEERRHDTVERQGDGERVVAADNLVAWPDRLQPLPLEQAKVDIFSEAPAMPIAPSTAPAPPPPAAPPEPPPGPVPPPLVWRYLGRMITPEGLTLVLLSRADGAAVSIRQGIQLQDGYEVLAIRPHAVRLIFPPTGSEVDVPIPPTGSAR